MTRGGADHYNVLHAAVYAEGSAGGSTSVAARLHPSAGCWVDRSTLKPRFGSLYVDIYGIAIDDWSTFISRSHKRGS